MKAKAYTFCICLLLFGAVACKKGEKPKENINTNQKIETFYTSELAKSIDWLDSISVDVKTPKNITFYKKARQHFKNIEPVLAAVDINNYKSLNAPNILQIQEEDLTDIKINKPFGFQVIEELLHEQKVDTLAIKNTVAITKSRLKLIKKNTRINLKDYHVVWLLRNQIIRTATTGITGFDSPVLGQSLQESQYVYNTLIKIIEIYQNSFNNAELKDNITTSFKKSIEVLKGDFNDFDRYNFIKNHTDVQLKLLVALQEDWNVVYPFEMAISNNATSLFGKNTIQVNFFSDYKSDTTQIKKKEDFGKLLFNDKILSKNNNLACASCHVKELAFTDGKKTFNNKQKRNSPTLTYAAYQQSFFMDARAGSLEGQVVGVANNHDEFNLPMDSIVGRVLSNSNYKNLLDSLYGKKRKEYNIRHAIASYVRSLNTFNSKFDNNINDEEKTLSASEKKGFNLFMGKAACATCHFPPIFNGTVPPNFKDTELEFIGVPETNDTINPMISDDLGRYDFFKTVERKHFFKTPTIRNIALTAPYMHNGVYNTLDEVMDFYNKGGGTGLGFDVPHQTLPFDHLELSEQEIQDIIAFMKTLTDRSH